MVETLQKIIEVWLKSKRHRSLKQLAEESGLNYGTIRNMADGKAIPNGETVLRLLLVVLSVEAMHEFVQEHLPHLSPYSKAMTEFNGRIHQPFSTSRKHCEVLLEITFSETSHSKLLDKFGPGAQRAIDDLIAADMIVADAGNFRLSSTDIYVPSQQFATELSKLIVDNINIDLRGNLILAQCSSLSIEATRQIYTLIEKTQNEILKIIKDPNNFGENRVAASLGITLF